MSNPLGILENIPFLAALLGVLIAQGVKPILHKIQHGTWNFASLVSTGGMPSSHSAAVMALAVTVGIRYGFSSTLFAIAMTLGMIVMYDAAGIRRHAGQQAMAINELEAEFEQHLAPRDPVLYHTIKRKKLKEMLGHQPVEVVAGAVTGVIIGILVSMVTTRS